MKVRAGPAGIHVFDRATGTNLLIDEARVPPTMWSPTPRSVSVALTNACDLFRGRRSAIRTRRCTSFRR